MPTRPRTVRAFAPGSVGNVGPGLDILGLALTGPGDRVQVELAATPGIIMRDPGGRELPADAGRNTAGLAAREALRRAGVERDTGLVLSVEKGLPLAAGQGGSAASAVAAAVAVNHLLGNPLSRPELLEACLAAEEAVAGRHADNVAPSLLGGIVLIRSLDPIEVVPIPVPENLVVVLVLPDQQLNTRDGRSVLPEQVSRSLALHQAAQVAAFVAACASGDLGLLGRAIDDRIAEPARASLLPGFREAKAAALSAGALGSSISGSGPTAFALAAGEGIAQAVAAAMAGAYRERGMDCTFRIAKVDRQGARIESDGTES